MSFRWLRWSYSLKFLLVVLACFCLLCGYAVSRRRASQRQDELLAHFRDMACTYVKYDSSPSWLQNALGPEYCVEEIGLQINTKSTYAPSYLDRAGIDPRSYGTIMPEDVEKLLAAYESGQLFADLHDLEGLVTLYLNGTRIDKHWLERLVTLDEVREVAIGNTSLKEDDLQLLTQMEHLEFLALSHMSISSTGAEHLATINTLKHLELRGYIVDVTPKQMELHPEVDVDGLAALAHAPRLEILRLKTHPMAPDKYLFGDEHIDTFLEFKTLKTLIISSHRFTADGVQRLRQGMPEVDFGHLEPYVEPTWLEIQEDDDPFGAKPPPVGR
jgi:hypothetical protein